MTCRHCATRDAFHCEKCGKHIGRTRTVAIVETTFPLNLDSRNGEIWCVGCVDTHDRYAGVRLASYAAARDWQRTLE